MNLQSREVRVGRIRVTPTNPRLALEVISSLARDDRPHLVVTPNVAHVRQAAKYRWVAKAYERASLCPPDGWPLVRLTRILSGNGSVARTTGADLLPSIVGQGLSYGLVGGRAQNALAASDALALRNPAHRAQLVESAPAEQLSNSESRNALIDRVAKSGCDVIFVGLGVPKQEKLALEVLDRLDRGVVICVGAAIDFAAGGSRRAPRAVQRVGLEWAFRLALEPRRLFWRYALAAPMFAYEAARTLIQYSGGGIRK